MDTKILPYIQSQMNLYGYSILLILGSIGNIFILILFYLHRHQPCSFYLFQSAVSNIIHLTINCFFKLFPYIYTSGTLQDLIVCKILNYIPGFLGQVPKTLLVCACIDRFMITSQTVNLRAFSTIQRAKYITCIVYLFWPIIQTHLLFWMTINNGQCTKIGWYVVFSAFYTTIFIALAPSLFLCIFSYLTYQNLKQSHRRIYPINRNIIHSNDSQLQKRDRDLLILVLSEVIIYIITTIPFSIVGIEMMITQFMFSMKSLLLIQIEVFALNVAILLLFIFSGIPFYTYIVVSASFRREFKQFIRKSCSKIQIFHLTENNSRISQLGT